MKYRITDPDRMAAVLAGRGLVWTPPVHQDDQAYAPVGWSYGQSKIGVPFARLRTAEGRHLFTVKTPVDNEMACVEHETFVVDREQMHRAVLAMGFWPTVRIVKTRRAGTIGDLSICLDQVTHAGMFLEVERRVGVEDSGAAVQHDLDQFVQSLGVPVERINDTYDSLARAALAPAG